MMLPFPFEKAHSCQSGSGKVSNFLGQSRPVKGLTRCHALPERDHEKRLRKKAIISLTQKGLPKRRPESQEASESVNLPTG
jgi:hypothetical protein